MDMPNSEQTAKGTLDWPHAPPHRLAEGDHDVLPRAGGRRHSQVAPPPLTGDARREPTPPASPADKPLPHGHDYDCPETAPSSPCLCGEKTELRLDMAADTDKVFPICRCVWSTFSTCWVSRAG